MVNVNYLFVGNPGTGKSTLINCLMQRPVCESGLSWGKGMTFKFDKHRDGSDVYLDTPGLADVEIEQQAAENITQALKEGGNYKLFFMVRLYQGRVVQDDVATIHKVLDSIDIRNVPFSVLVNQVKPLQYKMLMQRGTEMKRVVSCICSGNYKTEFIEFIPELPQLSEKSNAVIPLPPALIQFIKGTGPKDAPLVNIPTSSVKTIDADAAAFKEMVAALREEIAALVSSNNALEVKVRELEANNDGFWDTVGHVIEGVGGFLLGGLLVGLL